MKESTTKEKVLKKIRDALVNQMPPPYEGVDMDTPVMYVPDADRLDEAFAASFSASHGKFVFCRDVAELTEGLATIIQQHDIQTLYCNEDFLKELLTELSISFVSDKEEVANSDAAITGCEALVARHGNIMLSSAQGVSRKAFVMPPVHIVVAGTHQLTPDLKGAYQGIKEKYQGKLPSLITFVGGPSRTADIEKTLVYGVHGPKEVYLFLLDLMG